MGNVRKCPKCGKIYRERSAISRIDNSEICRACSGMEAVNLAVDAGAVTPKQAEQILVALQNVSIK